MSRAELAEAVNDYLWRNKRVRRELDAHTIARYERGVVRWPGSDYRQALRSMLGSTDAELGFAPVRRRSAAKGARDVAAVSVFSPFDPETIPSDYLAGRNGADRFGRSDVEEVRRAARAVASLENRRGGGAIADTAARHLRIFAPLLRGKASSSTRQEMLQAIGNLSGIAAYSAFDIAEYSEAERRFRFALWCADACGSWELRAATLADMSRKSSYVGNPDGALSLIELAQVRSDRLTFTTRTMVSTLRGQFLGILGRTDEALAEVERADEYFASSAPESDMPWMCYYDRAEHLGSTGKALIPVAIARNSIELAAPRLRQAIQLQDDAYPRSRIFSRTRLATLTIRVGDPRQAVAIGMQAADEAASLHSRRIKDELENLAAPYRRIPEVAELCRTVESLTSVEVRP